MLIFGKLHSLQTESMLTEPINLLSLEFENIMLHGQSFIGRAYNQQRMYHLCDKRRGQVTRMSYDGSWNNKHKSLDPCQQQNLYPMKFVHIAIITM